MGKPLAANTTITINYVNVRLSESVYDHLKNICQIEPDRHRSPFNFLVNLMADERGLYLFAQKTCH